MRVGVFSQLVYRLLFIWADDLSLCSGNGSTWLDFIMTGQKLDSRTEGYVLVAVKYRENGFLLRSA